MTLLYLTARTFFGVIFPREEWELRDSIGAEWKTILYSRWDSHFRVLRFLSAIEMFERLERGKFLIAQENVKSKHNERTTMKPSIKYI